MSQPSRNNEFEALYLETMNNVYAPSAAIEEDAAFIPTSQAKIILARLELARVEKFGFGLVYGPAGSGKTTTVRWYCQKHGGKYIRAYPNFESTNLLESMAAQLRIAKIRNYRAMISTIEEALLHKDGGLFAIDEAQLCTRNTLELMKYLSDETNCTFVLLTSDDFVGGIRRWRDIESRIGVTAAIGALELNEFYELYSDSGFTPEVLAQIHAFGGGVMRDVLRLIRQIDHVIDLNAHKLTRSVITPRLVKAGAAKLNLSGGNK